MQKVKCSRKVRTSKFENNDPSGARWWNKLFTTLEEEAAMPPEMRQEILEEIFPNKLLERLQAILSIKENKQTGKAKSRHVASLSEIPDSTEYRTSCDADSKDTYFDLLDPPSQHRQKPLLQLSVKEGEPDVRDRRRIGGKNPYLRFFRRRSDKAMIWRPPPPLSLEEMSLTQKAEAISEMIASRFVEWVQTIGGETKLTPESVAKMFEIGFDTHAAHSLCVKLIEMPSIPQSVADAMDMPTLSRRACLHRLIKEDIQAAKKKKRLVAFGRSLPMDMQIKPTKDDIARKWLHCEKVPEKLESMAAVWEGITHLRSTREFCEYLIDHPLAVPPRYLVDSQMLDPSYLHERKFSAESGADEGIGDEPVDTSKFESKEEEPAEKN